MRSKRSRAVVLAAVLATGLAAFVSACGDGGGGGKTNTSSSDKTFPQLKVVWGTTEYLDPGLAYQVASWQLLQDVYVGLVIKAHERCPDACTEIVPGLAESLPESNAAGTDYTFTLRKGLKYSNGEPIKASDFAFSIARLFKLNSGSISYYTNIVGIDGCEANPATCTASSITGITSDDTAGTIEIKLKSPQSDFLYVLSLPYSSLVPQSTPETDTESPPPPASGPYFISSYKPGRSFLLKRNPHWKKDELGTSVPNGNPDEIVGLVTDDADRSAQLVQQGQYMYDENTLPSARLAELKQKFPSQIKFYPTPTTDYFFLNEGKAPFNNVLARRAVNYAVDRSALVKLAGGLGLPTQNFLPPSYAQYKKINPYPYNLGKAKQLVERSGTNGDHVDLYTAGDYSFWPSAGEYMQGVLASLGYDVQLHEVAGANYVNIVGNQATMADIGLFSYLQDYPYPSVWFHLLSGDSITQKGNYNQGLVNFKDVNEKIAELTALSPSEATSAKTDAAWAAIDNELQTKYAATVPFMNEVFTSFFSSKMDVSCDVFTDSQSDLAQMCLK